MSENPARYNAAPQPAAFEPGVLRFRVWNPEAREMEQPDLYWFEGQGVREIGADGIADGRYGRYSVMRSSGLRDSAGREVFEGDIVQWEEHTATVTFGAYTYKDILRPACGSTLCYGWHVVRTAGPEYTRLGTPSHLNPPSAAEWRVVGNIYEGAGVGA